MDGGWKVRGEVGRGRSGNENEKECTDCTIDLGRYVGFGYKVVFYIFLGLIGGVGVGFGVKVLIERKCG